MCGKSQFAIAMCCALGFAPAASAIVTFTFDDPAGALEVSYQRELRGLVGGIVTYSQSAMVDLVVDATDHGAPSATMWSTRLFMSIEVGSATPQVEPAGSFISPISGSFCWSILDDMRGVEAIILAATFLDGDMVTLGNGGALITTDAGSLNYAASDQLETYLNSLGIAGLVPPTTASFTLTNVTPGFSVLDGFLENFTANSAFTGSADVRGDVIPLPQAGGLGLAGLTALAVFRRRRMHA